MYVCMYDMYTPVAVVDVYLLLLMLETSPPCFPVCQSIRVLKN